jgi:hypothetical protein
VATNAWEALNRQLTEQQRQLLLMAADETADDLLSELDRFFAAVERYFPAMAPALTALWHRTQTDGACSCDDCLVGAQLPPADETPGGDRRN